MRVISNYNKCSKLTLTQKIEEPLNTRMCACSEASLNKWVSGRVILFVGNVLIGVKDVFLLCCPLVLSLLKLRKIWIF